MKIGIMTFWWTQDNYGQVLQAYALQKYLSNLGHECFIIKYSFKTPLSLSKFRSINAKNLKSKLLQFLSKNNRKNNNSFNLFKEKYFTFSKRSYMSWKELKLNAPEADIYLVGSDQIWNIEHWKTDIINSSFLNFGTAKKISYAASFGSKTIRKKFEKKIRPLIKNFHYVSVREKSGINICKNFNLTNIIHSPDPTFLLPKNDYYELIKNVKPQNKKYCFVYLIQSEMEYTIKDIEKFLQDKPLEIKLVIADSNEFNKNTNYPGVEEFLSYINNAEFIITNSYHCSIFSIIFNKQFCVIKRKLLTAGMNDRFSSLEIFFKLNRFVKDKDFTILQTQISYEKINESVLKMQKESFLNKLGDWNE